MRRAALLLLLPLLIQPAEAKDEVTWIIPEFPPLFIGAPPFKGQGYGDKQLKFLTSRLPQFHHVTLNGTGSRLWHDIAHRDGVCTVAAAKLPEREKLAIFSARSFHGAANRVIIRTDHLARFSPFLDKSGAIALNKLAQDDRLVGSFAPGASYGPVIDAFIDDPGRKTPLEPDTHMRLAIGLLDKGRVDFAFGYYMELTYYRRLYHLGDDYTALRTSPEPVPQPGYVACSDGPVGHAVIDAIDAMLSPDPAMLAFIGSLRDWYSPEDFAAARDAVKSSPR